MCIEEHLSNIIRNYIVTSQQDKNTLMRMISSIFNNPKAPFKPAVIITKANGQQHNTVRHSNALQMSEVIVVNNAEVYNALVDHARIEMVLLAETREQAESYLQGNPGHQVLIHNATQVMYPQGGSNGKLVTKITARNGNLATQLNMGANTKRIVGVDTAAATAACRDALAEAQRQLDQIRYVCVHTQYYRLLLPLVLLYESHAALYFTVA
jgi:hypothetical protein